MKGAFSGLRGSGQMVQTHLQASPLPRADSATQPLRRTVCLVRLVGCCPDMERLLGLPSQQKSTRGHTASTGAPGGPAASGSGPLAPHPLGGGAGPSCGVGWGCPGPCGLRWLACPFSVVCRGPAQRPAFAPSLFRNGS